MSEIFKTIPECDIYEISNYGIVRRKLEKYIIKGWSKNDGTIRVNLSKKNKSIYKEVQVLVANAFLPKVEGKNYIRHIDGKRENNNVNNLEWFSNNKLDDEMKEIKKNQRAVKRKNDKAELTKLKSNFCIEKKYIEWRLKYQEEFNEYLTLIKQK